MAEKIRKPILETFLGLLGGLSLGLLLTLFVGENPIHIMEILVKSAVGSFYDLGMTLFYSTPLIFTGLSVAIAFQAGLFNIGTEGQLAIGALAAAVTGILLPEVPFPLSIVLATGMGFLAGGFWGVIAGWMKAARGSHEVITTIMLNFVAASLVSYIVRYVYANPQVQNPETLPLGQEYLLRNRDPIPYFFDEAFVSAAFPVAILTALVIWIFLWFTVIGFRLRAVGQNPRAAALAGIPVGKMQVLAMFIAGGLASMVGLAEVMGNAGCLKLNFSSEYGFTGIAVALLARNHPLGVVPAALFFGALHKGSMDLDFETQNVSRDLAMVFQALIILGVSIQGLQWQWKKRSGA